MKYIILILALTGYTHCQTLFVSGGGRPIVLYMTGKSSASKSPFKEDEVVRDCFINGNKIISLVYEEFGGDLRRLSSESSRKYPKLRLQRYNKESGSFYLSKELILEQSAGLFESNDNAQLLLSHFGENGKAFLVDTSNLRFREVLPLIGKDIISWYANNEIIFLKHDSLMSYSLTKNEKRLVLKDSAFTVDIFPRIFCVQNKIYFTYLDGNNIRTIYQIEKNEKKQFLFVPKYSTIVWLDSSLIVIKDTMQLRPYKIPIYEKGNSKTEISFGPYPVIEKYDYNGKLIKSVNIGEKLGLTNWRTEIIPAQRIVNNKLYLFVSLIYDSAKSGVYELDWSSFSDPVMVMQKEIGLQIRDFIIFETPN